MIPGSRMEDKGLRERDGPLHLEPCDAGFRPYRRLALSVLARALLDAGGPAGASADGDSARDFLSGSDMLQLWCHVAALDPDRIARWLERSSAGAARTRRQAMTPRASRP
jgi:hypothetical protein